MAKSIFHELRIGVRKFRRQVKKVQKRRQAKIRADKAKAKANVRKEAVIRKESRTTAEELRKTGKWEWETTGMHPKTVMEPVKTRNGWSWHPVESAANKKLNTPPPPQRAPKVTRTAGVVHKGSGDMKTVKYHANGSPQCPGCGYGMQRSGNGFLCPNYCGIVISDESLLRAHQDEQQKAQRCNAPTKDGHGCKNVGNCPIPAHRKARKGK